MQIIDRTVEKLVVRLYCWLFNLLKIDNDKKLLKYAGHTIEAVSIMFTASVMFAIGSMVGLMLETAIFFFLFGFLRLGHGEHYKEQARCIAGSLAVYVVFSAVVLTVNNVYALPDGQGQAVSAVIAAVITLLFRNWRCN